MSTGQGGKREFLGNRDVHMRNEREKLGKRPTHIYNNVIFNVARIPRDLQTLLTNAINTMKAEWVGETKLQAEKPEFPYSLFGARNNLTRKNGRSRVTHSAVEENSLAHISVAHL